MIVYVALAVILLAVGICGLFVRRNFYNIVMSLNIVMQSIVLTFLLVSKEGDHYSNVMLSFVVMILASFLIFFLLMIVSVLYSKNKNILTAEEEVS